MTGSLESLDLILSVIIDDEPACEIKHSVTDCTTHVTHIITGKCGPGLLMCDSAAAYKRARMDAGTRCSCGLAAIDCWKIRPV